VLCAARTATAYRDLCADTDHQASILTQLHACWWLVAHRFHLVQSELFVCSPEVVG
jgi:hypothetical protein